MVTLAELVYRLTLALWTGAMAFLALLAAPALFAGLPRDEAARAVGLLFPPYLKAGYVAAGLLFAAALVLARAGRGHRRRDPLARFRVLATGAMLALALYGGLVVYPKALVLLGQVPSFNGDELSPARAEFRRVHGLAFGLNGLALALSALLLLAQTVRDVSRRQG